MITTHPEEQMSHCYPIGYFITDCQRLISSLEKSTIVPSPRVNDVWQYASQSSVKFLFLLHIRRHSQTNGSLIHPQECRLEGWADHESKMFTIDSEFQDKIHHTSKCRDLLVCRSACGSVDRLDDKRSRDNSVLSEGRGCVETHHYKLCVSSNVTVCVCARACLFAYRDPLSIDKRTSWCRCTS